MKKIKNATVIFLGLIVIVFNGCKKTETPGPAGKDGSSNVSSTVFSASTWLWSTPYYYVNLNVPEITSENLNSVAVIVYFNTGGTNWTAVPYTQYNSPYNYFMGFTTNVSKVQVTWFYDSSLSSGDDPNTYYGTTVKYKVVVIPPAMIERYPNINLDNYSEVKKAFDLID